MLDSQKDNKEFYVISKVKHKTEPEPHLENQTGTPIKNIQQCRYCGIAYQLRKYLTCGKTDNRCGKLNHFKDQVKAQ